MSLGMSYAHVPNALHFDYSGYPPFCCYDWPHETTPAALARNQKGVERFLQTLAPTIAVDGNTDERPARRLSHDYCSDREAQRVSTRAFRWRSRRSGTDLTDPEQHHP